MGVSLLVFPFSETRQVRSDCFMWTITMYLSNIAIEFLLRERKLEWEWELGLEELVLGGWLIGWYLVTYNPLQLHPSPPILSLSYMGSDDDSVHIHVQGGVEEAKEIYILLLAIYLFPVKEWESMYK